ncbi:endonuclease [Polymorphobacter glacialis]|uniref:Endonuclease n=1 Tax=Sandarakinorhabdus glacialis TaxID=1614636 RepID=A0A916ZSW3_9SPHN|nr:GIY-YIG nuclease family protein [Polymorphobacter glacialis]GGE12534.1 endonuclease [Polymorphobacter glacialis]
MRQPVTYIMASQPRGTLYIGVTSNLAQRLQQHRNDLIQGFTSRYGVHRLVLAENQATMPIAIAREKQPKNWHRDWKINLIEASNPHWIDLAEAWNLAPPLK